MCGYSDSVEGILKILLSCFSNNISVANKDLLKKKLVSLLSLLFLVLERQFIEETSDYDIRDLGRCSLSLEMNESTQGT